MSDPYKRKVGVWFLPESAGGRKRPVASGSSPTCRLEDDERHWGAKLFGEGGGQELADELGVPLIASIPLDPLLVVGGDEGTPVVQTDPGSPAALAVADAAKRVVELVPPVEDETCTARIDRLVEGLKQVGT